jgi:hypothetical protein
MRPSRTRLRRVLGETFKAVATSAGFNRGVIGKGLLISSENPAER